MKTPTGRLTAADRARFDAFQRIGCIACWQRKRYSVPEVHHLLSGNKRRGHRYTVPLCPAHHRGIGHDESQHGPCLAKNSRAFRAAFGADETLLTMTDQLIEQRTQYALIKEGAL